MIYVHVLDHAKRENADRLDAYLSGIFAVDEKVS